MTDSIPINSIVYFKAPNASADQMNPQPHLPSLRNRLLSVNIDDTNYYRPEDTFEYNGELYFTSTTAVADLHGSKAVVERASNDKVYFAGSFVDVNNDLFFAAKTPVGPEGNSTSC
jgi:hypothetical protein